jgi:serine/threonine protein kinase
MTDRAAQALDILSPESLLIKPIEPAAVSPEVVQASLAWTLGKYTVVGSLGRGGMADVFLAMADGPVGFRKLCVLKTTKESLIDDDEFREMFLDEARLAARLTHPNIVQTYEVENLQGRWVLAMEFVEGPTLARLRKKVTREQVPLHARIRILCDVLAGLHHAHNLCDFDGKRLAIVHRDVSPNNILISTSGVAKLFDFGIAKSAATQQVTQAGVVKGKVGYMAPEQANFGTVDHRADLFSVGVILWEEIAGRRLIDPRAVVDAMATRIAGNDTKIEEVVPDIDPTLRAIVEKAIAHRVTDRYETAEAFQLALEGWLHANQEPPRRTWAVHVAEAYAPDHAHLQAAISQASAAASERSDRSSVREPRADAAEDSGRRSSGGLRSISVPLDFQRAEALDATQQTEHQTQALPRAVSDPGDSGRHSGERPRLQIAGSGEPMAVAEANLQGSGKRIAIFAGIGFMLLAGIFAAYAWSQSRGGAAATTATVSATVNRGVETPSGASSASAQPPSTSEAIAPSVASSAAARPASSWRPSGVTDHRAHPTEVHSAADAKTAIVDAKGKPGKPAGSTTSPAPAFGSARKLDEKDPYAP